VTAHRDCHHDDRVVLLDGMVKKQDRIPPAVLRRMQVLLANALAQKKTPSIG
jgi:hypothetical protein